MSDEEYPNFGNADPTASTAPSNTSPDEPSTAYWDRPLHPEALASEEHEAEAEAEADDDFYERYPGATPKKQQQEQSRSRIMSTAEDLDNDSMTARIGDAMSANRSASAENGAADEEARREELEAATEHPQVEEGGAVDPEAAMDEEAAVFHADETAVEQERDLERVPEPEADASHDVEGGEAMEEPLHEEDAHEDHAPEERYEHQGGVPDMEAAQDEEPDAPLLEDEEAPPTTGQISGEPTFALDGESSPRQPASKAQSAPPHIDRSFTTNFTEMSVQELPQETIREQPEMEDWPAQDDDKTFAELLDHQRPQTTDEAADLASQEVAESSVDNTLESISGRGEQQEPAQTRPTTQDWPQEDSDDDFTQMLGGQQEIMPEHLADADVAAQGLGDVNVPDAVPEPAAGGDEEDLAAKFAAALDFGDDDFLAGDDELLSDADDELLDDGPDDHDPSKLFGDQDGLLEDEPFLSEPQSQQQAPQQSQQQARNVSSGQDQPASQMPHQSPFATQSPFIQQNHGRSAGTPDTGLFDIYNTQPASAQQQPPQRPGLQTAQSFVDKSKSGYQAYGDLPMEVVRPRRRPAQLPAQTAMSQPPPRTSSFGTPNSSAPPTPQLAQGLPLGSSTPSIGASQSSGPNAPAPPRPNGNASAKGTPSIDSGFFADLPVAPKLRARPSSVFTPQTPGTPAILPGPTGPPQVHPSRAQPPPPQPPQRGMPPSGPQQQPMYGGLRQPERMPLLPDESSAPAQQQPPPGLPAQARYSPGLAPAPQPAPSRYSPAPAATSTVPAASRYSPAPGAQPGQGPRRQPSSGPGVHPFAPRTSSPLAYATDKPHPPLPAEAGKSMTMSPPRSSGVLPSTTGSSPERKAPSRYSPAASSASASGSTYGGGVVSPPELPPTAPPASGAPPRPRTQSPGAAMKQPRYAMISSDRPTSATGIPTMHSFNQAQQQQQPPLVQRSTTGPALPHRRQFSRDAIFAVPQDERGQDLLERWKGQPIFTWGASGAIVYTFPKVTPFWGGGPGQSSVRSTPGEITLTDATSFQPMDDRNAKFPGPLPVKGKGKKKDVLTWMTGKIEDLERQVEGAMLDFNLPTDLKKRTEEKLVLWKITRVFVENDGVLEGSPKIEDEVRKILLPNLAEISQVVDLQSSGSTSAVSADPVDKTVLLQLRQALLDGQRERAVWLAEEKKLWGHAMLIASTMGPEIWKQIIQSFVRSQVKIVGSDARSLAALYQVFAGNADESVDELVPPSARAGFQMVSKSDGSVTGNPMEGLEQWRETLGLVVGNRTPNDGPSLLALGKLLMSYGRAEAASSCFLFARAYTKHTGADDAEVSFVLLGANHQSPEESLGSDLDTIILTEIYEWACSLSAQPTAAHYIPHLQSYKFIHAHNLAGFGLKTKAQAYCDQIAQAPTSNTRTSPYYHPAFKQAIVDLQDFLAQAPADGKGGIFGRPAINKVSSGAATWFNKFVSGGEDESPQEGSMQGAPVEESGPFGRVSGEMSRKGSVADIYGSMMTGGNVPMTPGSQAGNYLASSPSASGTLGAGGRYAPGGAATHRAGLGAPFSPESNTMSASTLQQQRPLAGSRAVSARYAPATASALSSGLGVQGLDVPRPEPGRATSDYGAIYNGGSRRGSTQTGSSQSSYNPTPNLAQEPSLYAYQSSPLVQPYQSADQAGEEDAFTSTASTGQAPEPDTGAQDAEGGSYGGGFQPIGGSTGYEPPSYQPYEPDPEPEEGDAPKPKKKSIMDLDDDDDAIARQAAALKKAQADREADDAFRKAAEADAARDKEKSDGKKAGWLGGWFGGGGKKESSADLNKPIKAKLGEENSFVYDEALGKWVNKKASAGEATAAAATPPPPMRGRPV
ncbi:COPII coat assembly protein sec16, partial [Teratosphaeria destructans]